MQWNKTYSLESLSINVHLLWWTHWPQFIDLGLQALFQHHLPVPLWSTVKCPLTQRWEVLHEVWCGMTSISDAIFRHHDQVGKLSSLSCRHICIPALNKADERKKKNKTATAKINKCITVWRRGSERVQKHWMGEKKSQINLQKLVISNSWQIPEDRYLIEQSRICEAKIFQILNIPFN